MSKKLVFLTSIMLALLLAGAPVAFGAVIIERQIADELDDVEEDINPNKLGEIDSGSSDLELAYEDNDMGDPQFVGVRFINIDIAPGTQITSAWVRFQVDETKGGTLPVNLIIEGELSPNPARFVGGGPGTFDISNRPRTTTRIQWSVPNWENVGDSGPAQTTVDIAPIIQELIDQPDWASGNAIVLIFSDDPDNPSEGIRAAEAGPGNDSALLHIEFDALYATEPSPANGTTDMPWYIVPELNWAAGASAQSSNVYLSTNLADVTDANASALVSEGQVETTYQAPPTELETTYYWRVDSINADGSVVAGTVWSYTTEAVSDPITSGITATAESQDILVSAENTVNGSGLTNGLHGTAATDMWLSAGLPATIQFDFEQVYSLHEMHVWNQNQAIENILGFGAKDVIVEISENGVDFIDVNVVDPLNQAPATEGYAANSTIAFNGALARSVRMTITSAYGAFGQAGLSEVQFTSIPAFPRELSPASASDTDGLEVDLSWRAGRFAVEHRVVASKDESAVEDGSAVVDTTADKSYTLSGLDYGSVYFVRIVDVGHDGTTYAGPINYYITPDNAALDDFESYTGKLNKTWKDGAGNKGNGASVGAAETDRVYEGGQSMAIDYDMNVGSYAFTTRTFDPPLDLTVGNPDTLGIYFLGDPNNNDSAKLSLEIVDHKYQAVRVNHPESAATKLGAWTLFEIPFSKMKNLNLKKIQWIKLRLEGSQDKTGTLVVDYLHVSKAVPATWRVSAGSDDAEEHVLDDGRMDLGSSDLELGYEGNMSPTALQTIGCRWVGVGVPQGATITAAWVQFSADDINNDYHALPVSVVIKGQLSPNPETFTEDAGSISARATTSAEVVWDIPQWMTVHGMGPEERSPDISSVIQEIVDQPDWAGDAIVLLFADNPANPSEGAREAESFNGRASDAPLLHISFE